MGGMDIGDWQPQANPDKHVKMPEKRFHGGNMGSNPVGDANMPSSLLSSSNIVVC
jgi:hypothetical protein